MTKRKKILAIGAYERDNFGDILFYYILKKINKSVDVVPSSIFFNPGTGYLNEEVLPYGYLLESIKWDLVWVVGGEVGGVDMYFAYSMSLPRDYQQRFVNLSDSKKQYIYRIFGTTCFINEPAYIPNLGQYLLNKKTPLIINSVGLSNIKGKDKELVKASLSRLRSAKYLSVRDKLSREYLSSKNINSYIAPDIVHIAKLHEDWFDTKDSDTNNIKKEDYFLIQVNESTLNKWDEDSFINELSKTIKLLQMNVKFFASGTAPGHDNIEVYKKIAKRLNEKASVSFSVDVIETRDPVKLLNYIRYSSFWIGTSLHGRIISCSFDIPRISLENKKVAEYSELWDSDYPHSVELSNLSKYVEIVMTMSIDTKQRALSKKLALDAQANLNRIFEIL